MSLFASNQSNRPSTLSRYQQELNALQQAQFAAQQNSLQPIQQNPVLVRLPELMVVEALVGWRRWSVTMFGEILMSNNNTPWKPYEKLAAECKSSPSIKNPAGHDGCGGVNCTCGIYAYKNRVQAQKGENSPSQNTHIWGQVSLWGRVIEHETGFRSQFAYPKAFVNDVGIAERMAYLYGVKLI